MISSTSTFNSYNNPKWDFSRKFFFEFLSVLHFDFWLEVFKENTKSNELEFRDFCDQKKLSDQEWQYKSYLNIYTECTLQAHGRIEFFFLIIQTEFTPERI